MATRQVSGMINDNDRALKGLFPSLFYIILRKKGKVADFFVNQSQVPLLESVSAKIHQGCLMAKIHDILHLLA